MTQEQLHKPEASPEVPVAGEELPQEQPEQKPEAVADVSPTTEEKPKAADDVPSLATEEAVKSTDAPSTEVSEGQQEQTAPHHKAVTYGDVFPAAVEPLSSEAITTEDASLMQTAEAMAFGHTLKGGAASAMQAAAAQNVHDGLVEKDAHSRASEYGLSVTETSVPGATMDVEYVAGQPVSATAHPTPTDPTIAALEGVTIGEVLFKSTFRLCAIMMYLALGPPSPCFCVHTENWRSMSAHSFYVKNR